MSAMARLVLANDEMGKAFERGDARAAAAAFARGARAGWLPEGGARLVDQAARRGDSGLLAVALAAGASPNAWASGSLRSALGECAVSGRVEMAEVLLAFGANPRLTGLFEMTPMHMCCDSGAHRPHSERDAEMIGLLMAGGADLEARNHMGMTPLLMCCAARRYDLVPALLELGADARARADEGQTALALAMGAGREYFLYQSQRKEIWAKAVEALLEAGCDPSLEDRFGHSGVSGSRYREMAGEALWAKLEAGAIKAAAGGGRSPGLKKAL